MTISPTPEPPAPVTATPIARRTVLAGAAWSVPAIALTTGSPAIAASGTTLSFSKSAYSGPGCSTINDVTVTASDNGTPKAGVSVTVSVASGFVFTNGGTTSTGVTGSNGAFPLPGISVPATGGNGTASATASGAPSTSATLVGTDATIAKYIQNGAEQTASGVPSGSRPASGALFLAPDGRLLDASNNNAVIASNVAVFGELYRDQDNWTVPLRKTDGTCTYLVNGMFMGRWEERTAIGVPSGSTPVCAVFFLTPDNRLMRGDSGSAPASNVASWGQTYWNGHGQWRQPLKKIDGTFTVLRGSTELSTTGVPSGSTPAADNYFLDPNGNLIDGTSGIALTSSVDRFGRMHWDGSVYRWPLEKKDGSFSYLTDGTETVATGIPSGSTPVASAMFLSPDGRLIDAANANTVLATHVSAYGEILRPDWNGNWQMPLGIAETTPALIQNGSQTSVSGIPDNSQPAFVGLFLTPDARLLDSLNSAAVIATNVDAFGGLYRDHDNWAAPVRSTDGTCTILTGSMSSSTWQERSTVGVPAGSTPVAHVMFLTADRQLVYGLNGNISSQHVASWGQGYRGDQPPWRIPLEKTDGSFSVLGDFDVPTTGVPTGSKPAADVYFHAPDGSIIAGDTGTVLVTNVDAYGQMVWDGSVRRWPLRKKNGSFTCLTDGTETAATGVPSGSTPLAAALFLAPDGRVIAGDTGAVIATAVHSGGELFQKDWSGHWLMTLALKRSSC